MIVATTGNKVVGVSLSSDEEKELLEVSSHHHLVGVVVEGDQVFLSIEGSLTMYVCTLTGSSLDIISIIDCTNTITSSLKSTYVYVCMYVCVYVCMHMYVCMYIRLFNNVQSVL